MCDYKWYWICNIGVHRFIARIWKYNWVLYVYLISWKITELTLILGDFAKFLVRHHIGNYVTSLQCHEDGTLGSHLGLFWCGWGFAHRFFCCVWLEQSGYCLIMFCLSSLPLSWSFEKIEQAFGGLLFSVLVVFLGFYLLQL